MAILTEEVGELARVMSRIYGEQSFKENDKNNIGEELADILFVVLCIANQTNTDLNLEFQKKMKLKSIRDKKRHKNNPKINASFDFYSYIFRCRYSAVLFGCYQH